MARLKIYHLTRTTELPRHLDTLDAAVVIARDEQAARELASSQAKDEGTESWAATGMGMCVLVGNALPGAQPGVICMDVWGF